MKVQLKCTGAAVLSIWQSEHFCFFPAPFCFLSLLLYSLLRIKGCDLVAGLYTSFTVKETGDTRVVGVMGQIYII